MQRRRPTLFPVNVWPPLVDAMTLVLATFALIAVIAALGVFAAIPIKRQLIDEEQLAFPTGKATAETIVLELERAVGEGEGLGLDGL